MRVNSNEMLESVSEATADSAFGPHTQVYCDKCGGVLPKVYDVVEGVYLHYVNREPEPCECEEESND